MNENQTLEQAQNNKKRHIAAKLLLDKHHRILDIGSGWGGLGMYLSRVSGAHVTGITLSKEQQKVRWAVRATDFKFIVVVVFSIII